MKTDVYNYWTKEELQLLKKLYANTVTKEIADRLKRSAGSVKTKARQLGLKKSQSYIKAIKSRPRKRHKKRS
jgi:hypothetical protein